MQTTELPAPTAASALHIPMPEPWPEPVDAARLLHDLRALLLKFLVLPKHAAETLALWILHTYAFELRDVSTYLGIESPLKRCGKTTLLTVLSELVHRPVVASNISPSAFFRVIEQLQPTLLIDEADTVLRKNEELRGILNAGYKRDTAYVVRVTHTPVLYERPAPCTPTNSKLPQTISRFSTWCPKAIAAIGHLPDTLADRSILIRMQRKTSGEHCERLRNLDTGHLRRRCARFVLDHRQAIATAEPQIPPALNDRAADIWEPLLVLADLAGDTWPAAARDGASALSAAAHDNNPISSLFLDILLIFSSAQSHSLFTRDLLQGLTAFTDRPWLSLRNGHRFTERWLSDRLREYEIRPRCLRLGAEVARGYHIEDFRQAFKRYISESEIQLFKDAHSATETEPSQPTPSDPLSDASIPKTPSAV